MDLRHWRRDETVGNGLALVGVCLAVASAFFQHDVLSSWTQSQVQFIRSVLLLDFGHVFFTYLSLHEVPEMREWVERKSGGRPWLFWLAVLATLVFFFFFSFAFLSASSKSSGFRSLFFFAIGTMPLIHSIRQTKGLAQLQTRVHRNEKAEKREGWMFQVFLLLVLLREIPFLQSSSANSFIVSGELLLIAGLFAQAFILERGKPKQKLPFLMRMFAYIFHSPAAYLTIGAIHGTDYLRVTQLQVANSSLDSPARRFFFQMMIVGIALAAVIWTPRLFGDARETRFATSLAFAFIYTHYVLDFFIYRMKDPTSRQLVAPLLRLPEESQMTDAPVIRKAS